MAINARQITLQGLRDWDDTSRFADDILAGLTKQHLLAGSNRALVQELFYGTLRNLESIDFVIEALRRGSLGPQALWVLRLGIYQLYHTHIAEHAILNETVGLMPKNQRGFVNAILRNSLRQKADFEQQIEQSTVDIRESHPEWLVERWQEQLGEDETEKLCAWNNVAAPVYARFNPLADVNLISDLRETLDADLFLEKFPEFFRIDGPIKQEWLADGLIYIQDPSTIGACELLNAQPGETILDACAAPGGKTAFLAGELKNEGTIIAADNVAKRITRLQENLDRMRVTNTNIRQLDWLNLDPDAAEQLPEFDAILVDVPCSNTGVMRRRVDVRWRLQPWDFERPIKTQMAISEAVLPFLKSGGRLIYSTCSIDRDENEAVIDTLLSQNSDLAQVSTRRTLPWIDGIDGSFAAQLVKA